MATTTPSQEGRIPFHIPSVSEQCFTFYKVIGDLASTDKSSLICLHGGPGAGHEYLLCFGKLWETSKIPVILYDQIGCASSTHLRDTKGDESLWQESLFIDELKNLISHLKLERYSILGHSWGAILGASFASMKPPGFERLILCSPTASLALQNKLFRSLVEQLPSDARDVIFKHDDDQEYDKAEYKKACQIFFKIHAYRDEQFPGEEFGRGFANLAADDTVPETMLGPKFMTNTGSLKDWSIESRLNKINIPVLLMHGEFDYVIVEPYFKGLEKVRWVTIGGAAHAFFLENAGRQKALELVDTFLED